MSEALQQMQGQ